MQRLFSPQSRGRILSRLPLLGALGVVAAATYVALPAQEAPPPEVRADEVDLSPAAEPLGAGWVGEAEVGPELVGVEWQGDPGAEFTIETRTADGTWVEAGAIEAAPRDEGPDNTSREAATVDSTNVTEPLWVGTEVTGVRVRLDEGAASDVALHAVESPPAVAPGGSAIADGAPILVGQGASPAERMLVAGLGVTVAGGVVVLFRARRLRDRSHQRRFAAAVLLVAAIGLTSCIKPPAPPTVPPVSDMISRAAWGADETLRLTNCPDGPDYMDEVKLAVVHHTVNSNSYAVADGPAIVRGIYAYHTLSLGYCDIAYNFLVDRFGYTYEGRFGGTAEPVMGAHARGFNYQSTGVALIGDFRTVPASPQAIEALEQLLAWKLGVHGINPWNGFYYQTPGNEKYPPETWVAVSPITYHNYTGSTECPGAQVINIFGDIHNGVSEKMGFT